VTASGEAPPLVDAAGLPVPEALLVPLLDAAARTVLGLDPDGLPAVLRPLAGFDRRGLQSNTARQQLRRAFEVDADFREQVVEQFREQPDVHAALDGWEPEHAVTRAEDAAERDDLPWLASALCAARPKGWAFGLGVVCAVFTRERTEKEHEDDRRAHETELAALEEARRRAETARDAALEQLARLERELKDERASRRERERRAREEVEAAVRARDDAESAAEVAHAALTAAEVRVAREASRARAAEAEARTYKRKVAELAAQVGAASAEREPVRRAHAVDAPPGPSPAAEPPAARGDAARGGMRARPPCPPGMAPDAPDALDAMLRTRGVVLVVDGYNVSMAGWGDATVADQRARMTAALERLHLRLRCDVVVVFDGADVGSPPSIRRSGVRVRFSADGQDADPVIVQEVNEQPARVPVIVASSDRWVREHAEAAGATAVPATTLLDVLRR
jgi:predicted RNA-binding protein with PIN domain